VGRGIGSGGRGGGEGRRGGVSVDGYGARKNVVQGRRGGRGVGSGARGVDTFRRLRLTTVGRATRRRRDVPTTSKRLSGGEEWIAVQKVFPLRLLTTLYHNIVSSLLR